VTCGYSHPAYARSLAEFGAPLPLPASDGWVLKRPIPGSSHHDAMGCYPLFACGNWRRLHLDLDELGDGLVSLALVTDPFGDFDEGALGQCFPDLVRPFKQHFVADLTRPLDSFVSDHHRRYARKALRELDVERVDDPASALDDWVQLYSALIERHGIDGIQAFSPAAFAEQLGIPGIAAFRARFDNRTVGMTLWYVQGDVGYYHLGAYSEVGYKRRASFGLFRSAFEQFADGGVRWLGLGAGAGVQEGATDGLARFKRGWSTGFRPVYFCGRIYDRERYDGLTAAGTGSSSGYFPAYRDGEFV